MFYFRLQRNIDVYRKISINTLKLKVSSIPSGKVVTMIYPLNNTQQVRMWWRYCRILGIGNHISSSYSLCSHLLS